jgi:uncharacterized protein (UPF0264 family)
MRHRLREIPSVRFAKVGLSQLAGCSDWLDRWKWCLAQLPSGTAGVAVVYADAEQASTPDPLSILTLAGKVGCAAVLWDTYDKSRGTLLEHLSLAELSQQIAIARDQDLLVVLAGSLSPADLPAVQPLAVDYIGVRGAVCDGSRTGRVRRDRVERFTRALEDQPADMRYHGLR